MLSKDLSNSRFDLFEDLKDQIVRGYIDHLEGEICKFKNPDEDIPF